jgi:hypothetical protein
MKSHGGPNSNGGASTQAGGFVRESTARDSAVNLPIRTSVSRV